MKKILFYASLVGSVCALIIISVIADVQLSNLSSIHAPSETAIIAPIAIILGASVKPDTTPSDALRDRLLVGVKLYQSHQVKQLLVSGDDGAYRADEVDSMKKFLIENHVPEKDILVDGHGYRTYESCKRAASVFHITSALVVTQRFHIARAVYLCDHLGVHAIGITSDLTSYKSIVFFWLRDLLSSAKAWWDIRIMPPASPVRYS